MVVPVHKEICYPESVQTKGWEKNLPIRKTHFHVSIYRPAAKEVARLTSISHTLIDSSTTKSNRTSSKKYRVLVYVLLQSFITGSHTNSTCSDHARIKPHPCSTPHTSCIMSVMVLHMRSVSRPVGRRCTLTGVAEPHPHM